MCLMLMLTYIFLLLLIFTYHWYRGAHIYWWLSSISQRTITDWCMTSMQWYIRWHICLIRWYIRWIHSTTATTIAATTFWTICIYCRYMLASTDVVNLKINYILLVQLFLLSFFFVNKKRENLVNTQNM